MDTETLAWLTLPPRQLPGPLTIFVLVSAFGFGALWGSFLNVVIARVPKGQSVVTPRSRCPSCGTQIEARDNVPILSWLLLRAKCRACGAEISARYPLIELIGGVAGAGAVARYGVSLASLELFVFILVLVAISFIDLDTFTVPYGLVGALCATGLGFGALRCFVVGDGPGGLMKDALVSRVIGGVAAGVMLSSIVIVATGILRRVKDKDGNPRVPPGETAMGWGDPLIFMGLGFCVGWQFLPLTLFLASIFGSVIGLGLQASGKLKGRGPISEEDPWIPPDGAVPFGPFLALGGILTACFGDAIHARLLPLLGLGEGGVLLPFMLEYLGGGVSQ